MLNVVVNPLRHCLQAIDFKYVCNSNADVYCIVNKINKVCDNMLSHAITDLRLH